MYDSLKQLSVSLLDQTDNKSRLGKSHSTGFEGTGIIKGTEADKTLPNGWHMFASSPSFSSSLPEEEKRV